MLSVRPMTILCDRFEHAAVQFIPLDVYNLFGTLLRLTRNLAK